jgi:uncharacterized protein YcaQ
VARVDLKAERKQARLLVLSAIEEPGADPRQVAEALAGELYLLAQWLGLEEIAVSDRGALARPLKSTLKEAKRSGPFDVKKSFHLEDA